MRVLLSTIGSRGDVQPLLALALELRALGHEPRLCAPPDFRDLIDGYGLSFVPIGPEVRNTAKSPRPSPAPSPEALRQIAAATVAGQFETVGAAAEDCDAIVGAGSLQIATRSIAELRGIRYFFAAYCPITLPSARHAPPHLSRLGETPAGESADYGALWEQEARRWNDTFGAALNEQRTAAGLNPVADVQSHIFTDHPLLAADATLGPWPTPADLEVLQTGAWILRDERPLPADLEAFLEADKPPVYFGFGSMRATQETGRAMVEAARELGFRAIVSKGWADLAPVEEIDCLPIAEVNQQALFPRVAAVVHHGGAGTTTAATRAGVPQVVVPQLYDQHYWAQRIHDLGIGQAHPPVEPTAGSLVTALRHALRPDVADRARTVAGAIRSDGATVAAQHLTA
ncbi:glycosyl transferase [Planotetraspora thailandica]|uniref:Glycosyl transferase n=1 Tax=Planotetraspora thailandica TaxID=487172 RepID=A0A8J3UYA8_9ACTN|nr:glycosyltransferase [Planotetraspora thailandica]GII52077.1 glycosyl transferase [Planotetraspora thailandica]